MIQDQSFVPLIQKAQTGDHHAMTRLLSLVGSVVLSYRGTKGFGLAPCVVLSTSSVDQEVHLRVMDNIQGFRGNSIGEFKNWVRSIVKNLHNARFRHVGVIKQNTSKVAINALMGAESDRVFPFELAELVTRAMAALSEPDRRLVERRILDGVPYEILSNEFGGVSVKVLRVRHFRAIAKMRSVLEPMLGRAT